MSNQFIYALLAGILPSLVWLFFWSREDTEQPEPRSLLAACFLGGMVTVFLALVLEKIALSYITDDSIKYIVWAGIEEFTKLAAVIIIAIKSKNNNQPVDVMIYCIAVALGFAAMENTLFIMHPLANGNILSGIVTSNLRFMGATLVHVVSSCLIGFSLSLTYYKTPARKLLFAAIAFVVSVAIHAAFNISVYNGDSTDMLKAFGWVWLGVVMMIILFEEAKAVRPRLV